MRLGIASLEGHVGICTCNLSIGGIEHFFEVKHSKMEAAPISMGCMGGGLDKSQA